MIHIDNVTVQFASSEKPTLKNLNFQLQAGQISTILGYSGVGKSVTMKCILGFIKPDEGQVVVLGHAVAALPLRELFELRKNFGMLFQSAALFDSLNVFENVAFPMREHRRDMSESQLKERVEALLKMVELEAGWRKMPSELSGGMRKRVGLARALALEPKILLFDEPTTGLDPVTARVIEELIVRTTRRIGASALIISHDVHAALRMSDFVSLLADGKMVEAGAPSEFVKSRVPRVREFLDCAGVGGGHERTI
jgi:phospholipid/cholesterol/gamma-HCH transport system ATP-binding protein